MYNNLEIQKLMSICDVLNIDGLKEKLDEIALIFDNYNKDYNKLTKSYKSLMEERFNSINLSNLISIQNGGNRRTDDDVQGINNAIDTYLYNIRSMKLLDFLKNENNNSVFIGANGCGKTTLVKRLNSLSDSNEIRYFRADKILMLDDSFTCHLDYSKFINEYKQNISSNNSSFKVSREFDYAIALFNKKRLKELDLLNARQQTDLITNLIINSWNDLIKTRVLYSDGELKVKTLSGKEYDIDLLSSGEKAILYFLITILLEEDKKYYFIDEPEEFLNDSVVIKLFDILEREKKDSIFVYLTHSKEFAMSRINASLYWIQEYDGENWKYDKLPEDDDLPRELIIDLVGNKRPVLFVESEDNNKLDYRLYNILFNKMTVKYANGCEGVKIKIKAYKKLNLPQNAFGIVDCDYRNDSELNGYRKNNIFFVPFFEVENFLMCEKLLKAILMNYSNDCEASIERVKSKVKALFIRNENRFIIRNILFNINQLYFDGKINIITSLDELKNTINSYKSTIDIEKLIFNEKNRFNEILIEDNYDKYLRYLDEKDIINLCKVEFNLKNNENYVDLVFKYLYDNPEFVTDITNEYLPELSEMNSK